MPSFSDFAGFEGFLFYSVGAKRALPPDRGSARSAGAIPSHLALVSQLETVCGINLRTQLKDQK
jgi:hypothetical protein